MRYKVYDDFLTKDECNELMDMARPRLEKATTWDLKTRSRQTSDFRTNEFMFFLNSENELIRSIEKKISDLTGYPIENGEGLQCARYQPGQYFKAHQDSFDPAFDNNADMLNLGGQRLGTFMVYLNDVPENYGGETWFTSENLKFRPEAGKGLFWYNTLEDNITLDRTTLHEALPTIHPYHKWIVTKWIRANRFGYYSSFQVRPQDQPVYSIKEDGTAQLAATTNKPMPVMVHRAIDAKIDTSTIKRVKRRRVKLPKPGQVIEIKPTTE